MITPPKKSSMWVLAGVLALWSAAAAANPIPERAPTRVETGSMGDFQPDARYTVSLLAGQGIVASATGRDGRLDTYLVLLGPDGREVAHNDDAEPGVTTDSLIVYQAQASGRYTLVVSNYPGTSGPYTLEIWTLDSSGIRTALEATRIQLSGPRRIHDTPHFRIHYTLEGQDAATLEYVERVAQTMEEVYDVQINRLGWAIPPSDGQMGGDGRYDVYLVDLLGGQRGESLLGLNYPEGVEGDNPNTPQIELYAVPSYLLLDNDYAQHQLDEGTPMQVMRATAAHEFHHGIQFGYDLGIYEFQMYYEATASWIETITFPEEEAASTYVKHVLIYPEVCFAGEGESDVTGLGVYGSWLFIQALVDAHGDQAPVRLWENIAQYDGWEALEATLHAYGDTLPAMVARYHVQNLLRDYALAPNFSDYTVWIENTIRGEGSWTYTGRGIQELAANYFIFAPGAGDYHIGVSGDDGSIELWAIGIDGTQASVFHVGRGADVSADGFDAMYIMAFHTTPAKDVRACQYFSYALQVGAAQGHAAPAVATRDAGHYVSAAPGASPGTRTSTRQPSRGGWR